MIQFLDEAQPQHLEVRKTSPSSSYSDLGKRGVHHQDKADSDRNARLSPFRPREPIQSPTPGA